MTSKHTPGKWKAGDGRPDHKMVWRDDGPGVNYKRIAAHVHNDADRRLIAAAPEMYEALVRLLEASGHVSPFGGDASVKTVRLAGKYMEAIDKAHAAIAKAEGRS
jgi:hypothetical protein